MAGANTVHPTAVIGPGVTLGSGNVVAPYAVILGPCRIGDRNWIGPHVAIGTPAQLRGRDHPAGWDSPGEGAGIEIGDDTVVREYVTVHQPIEVVTRVGDRCYLMSYAHVPHDASIGDDVTLSNSVQIGGHTVIGDGANIGLSAVIHQRLAIGGGAMIGMGSVVTKNVPPLVIAFGNPARVAGPNVVGLQRAGLPDDVADAIAERLRAEPFAAPAPEWPAAIRSLYDAHQSAIR